MTQSVHLVIVRRWNQQVVAEMLDEAIGNIDPEDPKGKKRLHILEAATSLFVQNGYRKTSVGQVASAAGVAKGTVYLYFETKIELLVAAIALEKREFLGRMEAIFGEDLDPRERLKRYLVTVLVMANEMPLVSRLMQGDNEWLQAMREMPREMLASNQAMGLDFLLEMIEDAVGPGRWNDVEAADRARVLRGFGAFAPMVGNPQIRDGLSIERFASILADMVVDGLAPAGPGPEKAQWKKGAST